MTNTAPPSPSRWWLPAAFLALLVVPAIGGALRLVQLSGHGAVTPADARFFATPLPIVLHILTALSFAAGGAFQFMPRLRQRHPGLHRVAGRVITGAGLLSGLSGLWLTVFFPPGPVDGPLLLVLRLGIGTLMVASLALGFAAIRRRDVAQHSAWMTRGYAIGLGAGTQALVQLPWVVAMGEPGELSRALLLGAGWFINLAVAEWVIRRDAPRPVLALGGVA